MAARAGFGRKRKIRERLPSLKLSPGVRSAISVAAPFFVLVLLVGGLFALGGPRGNDDSDDSADSGSIDGSGSALEAVDGGSANAEADSAERFGDRRAGGDEGFERTSRDGTQKPKQDRNASLQLKTNTGKVREVSDEAIQITESVGGVVISSQLTERERRASADLQLSIPTRELDATLDRLTDLATVESLTEAAIDITEPFVSAQDRLQDARDQRTELLEALGSAETEEQAEALRKQLRDVRNEISRGQARFDRIAQQARLSTVSLQIQGSED